MIKLEDLARGMRVQGVLPQQSITIVDITPHGDSAEIVYKRDDGQAGTQLLFRQDEANLSTAVAAAHWRLDVDSSLLRIATEAYRINLAYLFDSHLAVHTSLIEPLPHQITAVYGEMLPRQPLRFLLADDPGAGKTVMAGLLIKELMLRGDVQRCIVCAPGSLADQWQDELWTKFQLRFEILTKERIESSHSGNPFADDDLLIIRLDQVSRNEELQQLLQSSDWDLAICDEAHKMSATYFGHEFKDTKRFKLGQLLGKVSRHFLLMTATPHNGKEEDFQLFLSLLDADRFEGRYRPDKTEVDVSDLMRRMVKEKLLKFDGKPLFPERKAYALDYKLSPGESDLYEAVTEYVRQEFNRVEQMQNDGRRGTVGFALTILQRRLASSPDAIYRSLQRRRERLEERLAEAQYDHANAERMNTPDQNDRYSVHTLRDADDWEELSDYPDGEFEDDEIELVDSATAARTAAELEIEIKTLRILEEQAATLRRSGQDRKWEEMAGLMQEPIMQTVQGNRRKLVIFTEHRDTLDYLHRRISTLLGKPDAIVMIHGGIKRADRLEVQDRFRNEPDVTVLLATDAAGEGINLQRANLMVNYDLPWNPNRLEQRFGRIHRIGQQEVCHLWNLVAGDTREGHVYQRLLEKIAVEKNALNGQVFDVLGDLFRETPLRQLLVDAIRYGDRPEVRARLYEQIDNIVEQEQSRDLLEEHSLVQGVMDTSEIVRVRADMERATARRLQPHYIKAFFMDAFALLDGSVQERESGRYQIRNVPAVIRDRARERIGRSQVMRSYERICFDKARIHVQGKPDAEFVCPGHILLDTLIDMVSGRYRNVLNDGAILIDPEDAGIEPRALFFLEHMVRDAGMDRDGQPRVISREVRFVEINGAGEISRAGDAPYLDYAQPTDAQKRLIEERVDLTELGDETAALVKGYAIANLAPDHLTRVQTEREELIDKTLAAVRERLTKEINYLDSRAQRFKQQERDGKRNAKLNWQQMQRRADELQERLDKRTRELEAQRQIAAAPPLIVGRALVVPIGLLLDSVSVELRHRRVTEAIAMRAVMDREIALGHDPRDVSAQNLGYDIESTSGDTLRRLRFLEVKGRRAGAKTVTVTHNEMLKGLNSGEQYALVVVEVEDGQASAPAYIWEPPFREPDSTQVSSNYDLPKWLARSSDR